MKNMMDNTAARAPEGRGSGGGHFGPDDRETAVFHRVETFFDLLPKYRRFPDGIGMLLESVKDGLPRDVQVEIHARINERMVKGR